MLFVDTNVPMYLIGAGHPLKIRSAQLLERAVAGGERLVTDAEVFQEILHRYAAVDRRDAIQSAFDVLSPVIDEVFPIDLAIVEAAKAIVLAYPTLSARDAIHVATMQRHGVTRLLSFDAGFDQMPGLTRLS